MNLPPCTQCGSSYTYPDGTRLICPECAYEWEENDSAAGNPNALQVLDANGQVLQDGDSVTLIKDLKIKGSSQVLKQGNKAKNIRLQEGDHEIACKIDGVALNLKAQYVKKVN